MGGMPGGRTAPSNDAAARGTIAGGEERDRGDRREREQAGDEEREAQAGLHRG